MATTVTFSSTIEAIPHVQEGKVFNGGLRVAANTVEVAATSLDETNDRVAILAVPFEARPVSLVMFNDDLDSNGSPALTLDVGVLYGHDSRTQTVGTVVVDNCFATAITTGQSANTTGVEILFEALDINKIGKPIWELAGLTSNPGGTAYIAISVGTAAGTAAAGTVTMRMLYV
ncbi:MAG: hypothetical protein C0446_08315 [Chitinophaga sp.]|nr:hypothetical protein [Chitinophaga sp.]